MPLSTIDEAVLRNFRLSWHPDRVKTVPRTDPWMKHYRALEAAGYVRIEEVSGSERRIELIEERKTA